MEITDSAQINQELTDAQYEALSSREEMEYGLRPTAGAQPVPQLVRWMGGHSGELGLLVVSPDQQFIPWLQLKAEIEGNLLSQEARVPQGSRVITETLRERPNFVIRIVNAEDVQIGSVWLGGDPYKKWAHDGLVRLGASWHVTDKDPIVWRVMQRYSDGSYRTIEAL